MSSNSFSFSYKTSYRSSPYIKPKKRKTISISATLIIIIITALIFLVQSIVDYSTLDKITQSGSFTKLFAIKPVLIMQGKHLWTIITNIFLHGGLWHLAMNMFSLMFIGSFLERLIGKKRFVIFYLLAGIIASLAFVFLSYFFGTTAIGARIFGSPSVFALGASGAIFGIAAVLMILIPNAKVMIFLIPISMPLWLGTLIMLFGLWIISAASGLPIGNSAHFGGFVAGLTYGLYLRFKHKKKVALLDRYFSRR